MVALAFIAGVVAMAVVGYYKDKGFRAKVDADVTELRLEVLNVRAKLSSGETVVEADWEKTKTLFASLASKL